MHRHFHVVCSTQRWPEQWPPTGRIMFIVIRCITKILFDMLTCLKKKKYLYFQKEENVIKNRRRDLFFATYIPLGGKENRRKIYLTPNGICASERSPGSNSLPYWFRLIFLLISLHMIARCLCLQVCGSTNFDFCLNSWA